MKKTITVIGLGGVGAYFGFKIAQTYRNSSEVNVTFVARNETYDIILEKGLTLISAEHPIKTVYPDVLINKLEDIQLSDLILICVKEYDLEAVCEAIKDKIGDNTIILPLLNGADIYERIRNSIVNGIVTPACVYIASHIKEKACVEHNGIPGKIIMGKDPLHPEISLESIIVLLQNSGIHLVFKDDSLPDIWTKFCFIASFGLVTAKYNKSIGMVNEDENLKKEASDIMTEIIQIARLKGIPLSETIITDTFEKAATFPFHTPTSLQIDVQSQKAQNELDLFAGTILKYGKELNVEVYTTARIYKEIKMLRIN